MKAIFPGRPQSKLQAISTVLWNNTRLVAYISGSTLILLRGPQDLVQTINHEDDGELQAVSISEASGKIAVCTKSKVFIYKPYGLDEGDPKWSLQHSISPKCADHDLCSLSWGQPNEVLAGGSSLTLLDTGKRIQEIWSKELANPTKMAYFTPDASFIASTGWHDRMVKIWQRSFVGSDEERFDVSYLPHPSTVTGIRWHRRPGQDFHSDTVLYTACADFTIRIWAATDHHGLQPLQLWTELDMREAIVPKTPHSSPEEVRYYTFIMDGWEFESTVEHALQRQDNSERQAHSREHLMDVAYRNPDVCVVMDDRGNMSAWGLERVGCKARQPTDVFNIAIVENLSMGWPTSDGSEDDFVCFHDFGDQDDGTINVLMHSFSGTTQWLKAPVELLFDSSPSATRFKVEANCTGHSDVLEEVLVMNEDRLVITRDHDGHIVSWSQDSTIATIISNTGHLSTTSSIRASTIIPEINHAVFQHDQAISLWHPDSSQPIATVPCKTPAGDSSNLLLVFGDNVDHWYVTSINAEYGAIWQITYDADAKEELDATTLRFLGPLQGDRPASSELMRDSGLFDSSAVAFSASSSGELCIWSIDTSTLSLGKRRLMSTNFVQPSILALGKHGEFALIDACGTHICIWTLQHAHWEFDLRFDKYDTITSVEFATTIDQHSIIAIAFAHKILIYAQSAYTFRSLDTSWMHVKTIDLGETTNLPIVTCSWLVDHHLLVGAGNQLFVFDSLIEVPDQVASSLAVVKEAQVATSGNAVALALHSLRPSFHPEMVHQQVLASSMQDADAVLWALSQKLKYWTPGDYLPSSITDKDVEVGQPSINGYDVGDEDDDSVTDFDPFTEDQSLALIENLQSNQLPYLSRAEQTRLSHLVAVFGALEKHRKGLDHPGLVHQMQLQLHHQGSLKRDSVVNWQALAWAAHSDTPDVLVDLSTRTYGGKMLWTDARQCGLFMWLSDIEAVRAQFEIIARNEYTKTDERNPTDCSLYYLALRKKQVLVGLWRMASWNKEQKSTQRMLSNNFADPRWKTAALKNAYALLGLRRFEYAASFFLLADKPQDAVNVLATQIGDIQLAITVARVYEGDNGPVLKDLLSNTVLPGAAREGNRWLATWAFWLLGEKHNAMRALLEPLEDLIPLKDPPPLQSKHFRNNEPSLVHFFQMLRERIKKTPGDRTEMLGPKKEHDLVMRSAMCYVRAGCDLLALDLVREWRYSEAPKRSVRVDDNNVRNALDDAADSTGQEEKDDNTEEQEETQKSAPTTLDAPAQRKKVVEEPSAASILDSFDF